MDHLGRFEHLGFFAFWLASALVLGFLLFYVWETVHDRLETKKTSSETPIGKAES